MDRWDSVIEAVQAHHVETVAPVKELIGAARFDLYHGPSIPDDDYPGFAEAVDRIDNQLSEVGELWFDEDCGEIFGSEPDQFVECLECSQVNDGEPDTDCPYCGGTGQEERFFAGSLFYVDRAEVFRILLGRELASYL